MSMASDQNSAVSKVSSESCQLRRANGQFVCVQNKRSKHTPRGIFGSPDLTLPQESNTITLSSIKKSRKLLKATRKILEREFKAQIAPNGSVLQHTLAVLEHRLSANLKKLLPIWQKEEGIPVTDRTHLSKLKVNRKQHKNSNLVFPALSTHHTPVSESLQQKTKHSSTEEKDYSSIISVAARTHLTPRYDTISKRDCLFQALSAKYRNLELAEFDKDCQPQAGGVFPQPVPRQKSDKQGDSACYRTTETDATNKKLLRYKGLNSGKTLFYKEFFPVPVSGESAGPTFLSTSLVISPSNPNKSPKVQQPLGHHIPAQLDTSEDTSPLASLQKLLNSDCFSESYSEFSSKPEADQRPQQLSFKVPLEGLDMGSTRNLTKQNKSTVSQHIEQSLGVSERRSFTHLPSAYNGSGGGAPGKNSQLRSSKSFHGEIGNGTADSGPRGSNRAARGQTSVNLSRSNSNGNVVALRQTKKERQRTKILKPLSIGKNPSNPNKFSEFGQDFNSSSQMLPDPSTASYRLIHDVSFDEGSRCKGTNGSSLTAYVISEDSRNGKIIECYGKGRLTSTNVQLFPSNGRLIKSERFSTSDRRGPPLSFKEPHSLSFSQTDDAYPSPGCATSPSLRDQPLHGTDNSAVPTQPASATSRIVFRSTKDSKQSWNSRTNDQSFNGGGYFGSNVMQPGGRVDMSDLVSLSISPASSFAHKPTQSRDKNGAASTKSRLPSKYGARFDGQPSTAAFSSREMVYTDPHIGAPHSFQQRLTELSILETDTIKYERNRKIKRKSKADKDS